MQQQLHTPSIERRYEPAELEKIIELATRLQLQHHETMNARQVEQLGEELGISPEHIRQALTLIDSPTVTAKPPVVATPIEQSRQLTKRTMLRACKPGFFAGLVALVIFPILTFYQLYNSAGLLFFSLLGLLLIVSPVIASVRAGWKLRSVRAGALGGAVAGVMAWIAFAIGLATDTGPHGDTIFALFVSITAIVVCSGIGASAAALRQWWDRRAE